MIYIKNAVTVVYNSSYCKQPHMMALKTTPGHCQSDTAALMVPYRMYNALRFLKKHSVRPRTSVIAPKTKT